MPCLGGISPEQVKAWKDKIKWFFETRYLKELDRIDGEPMEFEWKNFPGFTALRILTEIQKMMAEFKCESEQIQGRILFMSTYNDVMENSRKLRKLCGEFCKTLQHTPKGFHSDVGHIWDLVVRKRGMELMSTSQMVNGIELVRS